jgi:L-fuconolactonase
VGPRRIDSHQHFWHYTPAEFAWIDESMAALRRDFLPADLEPVLAAHGIDGCIAVQAPQTLAETRFLLGLARQQPWIRGVVGWVDLQSPDVDRQLREFARDPRFVGVRHIAQAEPDRFLVGEAFQRGLAALAPYDLVYDLLVYPQQLPAAVELVARFPGQRFVLDHGGKPPLRHGDLTDWATNVRALARHANVTCKLSGLATEADPATWTPATVRPALDVLGQAFGPERLLFGSDWPVSLHATDYGRWLACVDAWLLEFAASARDAVFGGTCERTYRLPPPRRVAR